jgi:hypothetical protein
MNPQAQILDSMMKEAYDSCIRDMMAEIERLKAVIAKHEALAEAHRKRGEVLMGFVNTLIENRPRHVLVPGMDFYARATMDTAKRAEAVKREVEQITLPEVKSNA